MRQMLRTTPAAPAELAEGKWARGGLSQKHLIQDGPCLCRTPVSPIHRALDRGDSWTGPGVAQVEGQMETGLTDTLGMLKKRNYQDGVKGIPLFLYGFLASWRDRCLRPEGKGGLQRAS